MAQEMLNYVLFTYRIDHLAQKDKVLFYYALKGRDGKGGMLAKPDVVQLERGTILVPFCLAKEFGQFFDFWKCNFDSKDMKVDKSELRQFAHDAP